MDESRTLPLHRVRFTAFDGCDLSTFMGQKSSWVFPGQTGDLLSISITVKDDNHLQPVEMEVKTKKIDDRLMPNVNNVQPKRDDGLMQEVTNIQPVKAELEIKRCVKPSARAPNWSCLPIQICEHHLTPLLSIDDFTRLACTESRFRKLSRLERVWAFFLERDAWKKHPPDQESPLQAQLHLVDSAFLRTRVSVPVPIRCVVNLAFLRTRVRVPVPSRRRPSQLADCELKVPCFKWMGVREQDRAKHCVVDPTVCCKSKATYIVFRQNSLSNPPTLTVSFWRSSLWSSYLATVAYSWLTILIAPLLLVPLAFVAALYFNGLDGTVPALTHAAATTAASWITLLYCIPALLMLLPWLFCSLFWQLRSRFLRVGWFTSARATQLFALRVLSMEKQHPAIISAMVGIAVFFTFLLLAVPCVAALTSLTTTIRTTMVLLSVAGCVVCTLAIISFCLYVRDAVRNRYQSTPQERFADVSFLIIAVLTEASPWPLVVGCWRPEGEWLWRVLSAELLLVLIVAFFVILFFHFKADGLNCGILLTIIFVCLSLFAFLALLALRLNCTFHPGRTCLSLNWLWIAACLAFSVLPASVLLCVMWRPSNAAETVWDQIMQLRID